MNTFDFIEDFEEDDTIIEDILYDETFTKFLLDNNCYGKYLDNIREQSMGYSYTSRRWDIILNDKSISGINSWMNIIIEECTPYFSGSPEHIPYYILTHCVFTWPRTREGDPYWRDIDNHLHKSLTV